MSFILPNHEIKAGTEFNDSKYDISHQMLFQTPLFEIHIDDIDNRQLEKNIYKLRDETEDGLDKSNRGGGWHSLEQSLHPEQYCGVQSKDEEKYKLHPMDDSFKSLTDKLIDILHNLPFEPKIDRIDNMSIWAMINEKGSYNTLHNHPGCDIAGVYYFKKSGDDGNLFFCTPNKAIDSSVLLKTGRMVVNPTEGDLLLFPGWLDHGVQTNDTDDERVSVSFNIRFEGR